MEEVFRIIEVIMIGLSAGTIYAVMGVGFVLLYRLLRLVNIAVGDMVLIGAYLVMAVGELWLVPDPVINIILAVIIACGIASIIAVLTDRLLIRPVYGQSVLTLIMMTVALGMILRGICIVIWGTTLRTLPGQHVIWPPRPIEIGPIKYPYPYVWSVTGSILVFGVLLYMFRKTIFGFAMRALSLDPEAASAHGISMSKMYIYGWIIAYVTATLAGLILGAINGINIIISDLGLSRALPAALIGGLDSPGGALVGGLILGLIEHTLGTYLNMFIPGVREAVPYLVLLAVLIVKPYGLWGTVRIERV